jgi:bifunctional non-homologous end joining protein LigD
VTKLPEGPLWTYKLKLDGYRLEAVKGARDLTLYSRRATVLNRKFPHIVKALEGLPPSIVVDGEALDQSSHSNFNLLQNSRSAK